MAASRGPCRTKVSTSRQTGYQEKRARLCSPAMLPPKPWRRKPSLGMHFHRDLRGVTGRAKAADRESEAQADADPAAAAAAYPDPDVGAAIAVAAARGPIYHFRGAIPALVAHHPQIPGRTADRDTGRRGDVPTPGGIGHDAGRARHRLAVADGLDDDIAVAGAAGSTACQG